jgi:hypothetical protein
MGAQQPARDRRWRRRRPEVIRRAHGVPIAFALALAAGTAAAQPSPEESALADARFREGRELLDKQRNDEACAKFEESERLWPRGGTVLNVAACREKQGKLATAWAAYTRALALAQKEGRADREELARGKIAALQGELSWLVIRVPPALDVAGVVVTRDGVPVGRGGWGVPIPVDPGRHVIAASAPGQPPVEAVVDVGAHGDRRAVTLPAAGVDGAPPEPSAAPLPPSAFPAAELGMRGVVRLHVETNRPGVLLFMTPGPGVLGHPVCTAPCDAMVDGRDEQLLYFDGEGMTRSSPFSVSDKRGPLVARVSPGSSRGAALGALVGLIGTAGVVTGITVAIVGFTSRDALTGQTRTGLGAAGLATLGAGAAAFAGGIALTLSSRTHVDLLDDDPGDKARPLKTSVGPGGLRVTF